MTGLVLSVRRSHPRILAFITIGVMGAVMGERVVTVNDLLDGHVGWASNV